MKMKVLAAAILASLASAAQAEVVVYGMGMPFLDNARTSGATQGVPTDKPNQVPASAYTGVNDLSRWRITVGTSNWGFRGTEDLGPGLKAVWQLESGFRSTRTAARAWAHAIRRSASRATGARSSWASGTRRTSTS